MSLKKLKLFVIFPPKIVSNGSLRVALIYFGDRYNKREAAAYAASRLPASYGATLRVFHEVSQKWHETILPDFVLQFFYQYGWC